jgi:hypothetical protein
MGYRVRIPESLLRLLPNQTRITLRHELEELAESAPSQAPGPDDVRGPGMVLRTRPLSEGYSYTFEVNDSARTVTLLVVSASKARRPVIVGRIEERPAV